MKKLFFLLAVCFGLYNCIPNDSETPSQVLFTMFNNTDKELIILGYSRGLDGGIATAAQEIRIEPHATYKITRIRALDADFEKAFYSIHGVDSVRMIFDQERIKIFTPDRVSSVLEETIFRGDEDCQYFITEEDYNTADACNSCYSGQ